MSVNKVILVGNVGKDPEIRYFDTGSVKATFTLATNERGYTMANGTQGSQLYIEGKIRSRSYDDQSGNKRFITEINVDNLELLSRRSSSDEAGYISNSISNNHSESSSQNPINEASLNNDLQSPDSVDDLPF